MPDNKQITPEQVVEGLAKHYALWDARILLQEKATLEIVNSIWEKIKPETKRRYMEHASSFFATHQLYLRDGSGAVYKYIPISPVKEEK